MKNIFIFLAAIALVSAGCRNSEVVSPANQPAQPPLQSNQSSAPASAPSNAAPAQTNSAHITAPISNAKARITKKTFGLKVSPGHSPVSPEKFSGYHTGVDFETTPEEQNTDVPIMAICSGPLMLKKSASGYGGVAVQKCTIADQAVTVIYGHLRLSSISTATGAQLAAGQQIGVLGKGYSAETDGERKHLHLGIHKGSSINIKGYVGTQGELSGWLDAEQYL